MGKGSGNTRGSSSARPSGTGGGRVTAAKNELKDSFSGAGYSITDKEATFMAKMSQVNSKDLSESQKQEYYSKFTEYNHAIRTRNREAIDQKYLDKERREPFNHHESKAGIFREHREKVAELENFMTKKIGSIFGDFVYSRHKRK